MSVTWGFKKFKADPQKCYDELVALGTNASPEGIVEYAKDETTELHKCFQWDDTLAAEAWRRQQARFVAASLTVTIETKEHGEQSFRLIEHDEITKTYQPVVMTVRNMDSYAALLARAKSELASFKARYASIRELQNVFEEIEKVIK